MLDGNVVHIEITLDGNVVHDG